MPVRSSLSGWSSYLSLRVLANKQVEVQAPVVNHRHILCCNGDEGRDLLGPLSIRQIPDSRRSPLVDEQSDSAKLGTDPW